MSPAPILRGYVCAFCGNESIETPWDEKVFHCSQELGGCGATNRGPLLTVEEVQFRQNEQARQEQVFLAEVRQQAEWDHR